MFHDDGASTAVTANGVLFIASMIVPNGSRTSPEKLKPDEQLRSDPTTIRPRQGNLGANLPYRKAHIPKMASTT